MACPCGSTPRPRLTSRTLISFVHTILKLRLSPLAGTGETKLRKRLAEVSHHAVEGCAPLQPLCLSMQFVACFAQVTSLRFLDCALDFLGFRIGNENKHEARTAIIS